MIAVCVLHNICIQRDDLYVTDNNDSDDSSDDDKDGRIRLGVHIFKALRLEVPTRFTFLKITFQPLWQDCCQHEKLF